MKLNFSFSLQFYGLWKDPEGLKIMNTNSTTAITSDSKDTITQLNQEVLKLKQELKQVRLVVLMKSCLSHSLD